MRFSALSICFVLLLSSCQSSPVRQFSRIQPGMEKTEVLDLMGTPWTTTRLHGKDRWIYIFYEDNVRHEKEVHFQNGAAVYIGDKWTPEPDKTAEAKDKKNEELEKKFQEDAARFKEENKNAFHNHEKEVKGEGKEVKYMPDYEEIK